MTVLPQLRASVYEETIPSVERVNPVKIESLALASDRSETPLLFDLAATHLAVNPGVPWKQNVGLQDINFLLIRDISQLVMYSRTKVEW